MLFRSRGRGGVRVLVLLGYGKSVPRGLGWVMRPTPAQANPAAKPPSGSDPRCIPIKLEGPIPVGDEIAERAYSREEQETWRTLYARQEKLLPGRAADEFLSGLKALGLDRERIPALAEVSRQLERGTGWRIARTPGLLDAHDFFSHLSRRIFPCTDYIRSRSELDYTPAPDCFHDIFGHTPMIMHPRFATFYQKVGRAALACRDAATEEGLTRIYWFTVEFGLVRNPGGLRIYGNGIISSFAETQFSLTREARKRPFVADEAARHPYDIWHLQGELFVVESFEALECAFDAWAERHSLG
jgi:phenylalanine-4-hydroxylase